MIAFRRRTRKMPRWGGGLSAARGACILALRAAYPSISASAIGRCVGVTHSAVKYHLAGKAKTPALPEELWHEPLVRLAHALAKRDQAGARVAMGKLSEVLA